MKKYLSYIYVILSAVCWGFIGFSNRMLTEVGVSLGNRVFIRNFGTLLILTIVFALFHRQVFRIKLKHLPIFLCSGLLSILTLSLVYFQCQTCAPCRWRRCCCIWRRPSWCWPAPCCGKRR